MPFGTFAPSAWKDFGSRRNSTISCELGLGVVDAGDVGERDRLVGAGLICCGFVRGITFSVRHSTKMIAAKNRIISTGSQLSAQFWISCAIEAAAQRGASS